MLMALIFFVLVLLICLNVPIAVSLAVAGLAGILITEGPNSLVSIAFDMYSGATKFELIAIPMFVLAGAIMNAGGVTDRLINFVAALIGFVRGGLAMVNIGVSLFFAEISGSAVADVAAMGSILIPQMRSAAIPARWRRLLLLPPPPLRSLFRLRSR
jgi:TRAP-type mannitol/chloroaromatic compound transport system permease large subunit